VTTTPTTSEQVRSRLVNVLRRDLVGPSPHDIDLATERLPMEPSRWYLTGFIGPTTDAPEATEVEDPDPEGIDVGGSPDDRQTDESRTRRNSWRPSSIGITVLVPEGISQVTAVVTWGDYRTEPPMEQFLLEAQDEVDGPDQRAAPEVQWVRRPRHETTSVPIPNGRAQRGILVPNSSTPQLPGGALELTVHARPYEIELPDGAKSRFQALTVFLVNKRKRPRRRYEDISLAFQARLELVCEQGFVPRADLSGYGTDDWDRRVADLHYADAHEFAVGRNTSAEWAPLVDGRCTSASTCPLPMSEVERVAPTGEGELPGVEFGMEALGKLAAAPTSGDLSANLAPLVDLYDAWISSGWANFGAPADQRYKTGEQLVFNMRRARARIAAGIESLKTDSQARMAFCFMNDAIAKSLRRRSPERYPVDKPEKCPKWRPFQLAFVLLNLGGLVDRTHADREIVDLLFFPTGGGKTEAYLGLAAFTIAHRRLTHPGLTGAGVAVVMRYTLRLLTLDQLSRAAGVICALELARDDPAVGRARKSKRYLTGMKLRSSRLLA